MLTYKNFRLQLIQKLMCISFEILQLQLIDKH